MAAIPADFATALKKAGLKAFFADCTAAHQREYLKWIAEAKRAETRDSRIAQAIRMISARRTEEAKRAGRHS